MKNITENIVEVQKLGRNCMGTLDITMRIKGMRKDQEFITYPISKDSTNITIQSDTRIAIVDLDGNGKMSRPHSNGAYFHNYQLDKLTPFKFDKKDWQQIVEYIGLTEGNGTNKVVKIDNTGAKSIFNL